MEKLLLVDGNSIINRAFFAYYGRTGLTAPDGTPTGAVNGFFNTVLSVKNEFEPDYMCVLFDLKEPTFRHKLSSEYKANRKGMPEELALQMPVTKEILDLMGIPRMELATYEADDLIGTLSLMGEERGMEVRILSGDHDDFQLISDRVSVIMPKNGNTPNVLYNKALFMEEMGVDPNVFVYVKALMGDNSDNIKGVNKVGEKTALKLIADYGSIEGIYENLDALTPALRKNLSEARDNGVIDLNIKLCRIDRSVPIPYEFEGTRLDGIPDSNELYNRLSSLALRSLIKKLGLSGDSSKNSEPEAVSGKDEWTGFINKLNVKSSDASEFVKKILDETYSSETKPYWGMCFSGNFVLTAFYNSHDILKLDFKEVETAFAELHNVNYFNDSVSHMPASYDFKDKSKLLTKPLPYIERVFDPYIAGSVLNITDGAKKDFVRLFECCFACTYPISGDSEGQITLDSFLDNADRDADELYLNILVSRYIADRIANADNSKKLSELIYNIEFPLIKTLDIIERNGMHVDTNQLTILHNEFSERLAVLEKEIYELAGENFKISSPKQLSVILFEKLNLKHGKKGKTGVYSTSIEELSRLSGEHPIINKIIDYRKLSKLDSTYALGLVKTIDPDGRIRTTFTQAMTNTGRLSSTEPNLQNIPVRSEEGGRIREAFTASSGNVLVDADYSQIELRLLAALSGDETMVKAFNDGEDIHRQTATKMYSVSLEEVTPKMRAAAKTVNFSIVYGVSDYGLSQDLGVSFKEASDFIKAYGSQFPKVIKFLDGLKTLGVEKGYVETFYGRRRILTELSSQNRNLRSFGERAAMNTPIQGTAADIIKIAMNRVRRALEVSYPEAKLVMQVHDELIVECPFSMANDVAALLKKEMEETVSFSVPLEADVHVADNWLAAK